MNPTIDILMAHKSIRKFTDKPIGNDVLQTIVKAGQAAASSSFLQGVTIIRVTDPIKRKQLAAIAGNQTQVISAPEFLVFCADLSRPIKCCESHGGIPTKGFTEQFIISTVDTALYAQNAAIAAEAIGLGICYIGAIRNDPSKTSALLELPLHVYPVFGLCIGHPAENPEVKPRLPLSVALKENTYNASEEAEQIANYDIIAREYYATRTGNKKSQSWSEQMTGLLGKESRPHMRQFLTDQGFEMK
jgi:nitroreductase